jgi:hypothetical protein
LNIFHHTVGSLSLALRIPPPFSDGDGSGPGLDIVQTPFAIARLLA